MILVQRFVTHDIPVLHTPEQRVYRIILLDFTLSQGKIHRNVQIIVLTSEIAFSAPTEARASWTTANSALLLWDASFPPLSSKPLAELSARAATCNIRRRR